MKPSAFVALTLAILQLTTVSFGQSPQPAQTSQASPESALWESIKDSKDPDDYKAYLDKYPSGIYAPLAKRRIARLDSPTSTESAPSKPDTTPVQGSSNAQPGSPTTMSECEGTNNCATWTFLGTQGNGQWPSGEVANLAVEHSDATTVVIRRADSTGPSAGLTAVYKGTRHGDRVSGEYTSSWPGHWKDKSGDWYATIGQVAQQPPQMMTVCSPPTTDRCGTFVWNNGHYDGTWPGISKTATIALERFAPQSVLMTRTDHDDGKRFHYEGKISAEGDSIVDGLISGLDDGILIHFTAYWGQQLKYHPATAPASHAGAVVVRPAVCYPWFFTMVCQ